MPADKKAVHLLDKFDRYACNGQAPGYSGSPFEAEVNKLLQTYGLRDANGGITKASEEAMQEDNE